MVGLYVALVLLLTACVASLAFFHGVKMLVLSDFELGVIDAWTVTARYNRGMAAAMWLHVFATALALAPPVTSPFCFALCALIAILNWRRAARRRLLLRADRLRKDVARARADLLARLLLYLAAGGGCVALLARAPRAPRVYAFPP
jgi:hypothetical protein